MNNLNETVQVPLSEIKKWRLQWLLNCDADPEVDVVTPFDKYLYRKVDSQPVVVSDYEPVPVKPGYATLLAVLYEALEQAQSGKGSERHANGLPFHKQRMQTLSHLLRSADGMAYQACKKVTEGLDLPTLDAQIREMLGAINYIAGIVIYLRAKDLLVNGHQEGGTLVKKPVVPQPAKS